VSRQVAYSDETPKIVMLSEATKNLRKQLMLRKPLRLFGAFGKRIHVDSLPAIIPECRARSPNEPFVFITLPDLCVTWESKTRRFAEFTLEWNEGFRGTRKQEGFPFWVWLI